MTAGEAPEAPWVSPYVPQPPVDSDLDLVEEAFAAWRLPTLAQLPPDAPEKAVSLVQGLTAAVQHFQAVRARAPQSTQYPRISAYRLEFTAPVAGQPLVLNVKPMTPNLPWSFERQQALVEWAKGETLAWQQRDRPALVAAYPLGACLLDAALVSAGAFVPRPSDTAAAMRQYTWGKMLRELALDPATLAQARACALEFALQPATQAPRPRL